MTVPTPGAPTPAITLGIAWKGVCPVVFERMHVVPVGPSRSSAGFGASFGALLLAPLGERQDESLRFPGAGLPEVRYSERWRDVCFLC